MASLDQLRQTAFRILQNQRDEIRQLKGEKRELQQSLANANWVC